MIFIEKSVKYVNINIHDNESNTVCILKISGEIKCQVFKENNLDVTNKIYQQ